MKIAKQLDQNKNYIKIKNTNSIEDGFQDPNYNTINSFYLQSSTLKFATDNIKGWYIRNIYSETVKESKSKGIMVLGLIGLKQHNVEAVEFILMYHVFSSQR